MQASASHISGCHNVQNVQHWHEIMVSNSLNLKVISLTDGLWDIENAKVVKVTSARNPISKITHVNKKLWCAVQSDIMIVNPSTLQTEVDSIIAEIHVDILTSALHSVADITQNRTHVVTNMLLLVFRWHFTPLVTWIEKLTAWRRQEIWCAFPLMVLPRFKFSSQQHASISWKWTLPKQYLSNYKVLSAVHTTISGLTWITRLWNPVGINVHAQLCFRCWRNHSHSQDGVSAHNIIGHMRRCAVGRHQLWCNLNHSTAQTGIIPQQNRHLSSSSRNW